MNIKKILVHSLVGSAVLAMTIKVMTGGNTHKKPRYTRRTSDDTSYDEIDLYIAEQIKRLNIPGAALGIVEGDQLVHWRGFGRARPGGEAPTPQTPFFIGSLTKSFTATAVMQLVEAGKIELDAPIQHYLPWFRVADPEVSAEITVRQLLNQTSGLPTMAGLINLANTDNRPDAAELQARALSSLVVKRPVGAKFEYSNLNYNVLGLIIEAVSGETYAEYIQHHIFNPLGMCHSYTSKETAKQDNLAVGHRFWFGVPIAVPDPLVPSGSLSSGQLISSVEDMAHYLIAHLNEGCFGGEQILSRQGIDELHHPAAEIIEMGKSYGFYAMGWISQVSGESRIVSHSGIVPDFGAFMALLPEQNKAIILLVNANHAIMKMTLDEVGIEAAERLAGEIPTVHQFDAAPWVMRGMLLIPILQIAGVAVTTWQLHRWRRDPILIPSRGRMWRQHILLPLIPNMSFVVILLVLAARRILLFMKLFMPDDYWIVLIGGGFAGLWSFLRTGLILWTQRKSSTPIPRQETVH